VTVTLLADLDGEHVPLTKCDWVLWGPCGCPWGVAVARYAATQDAAWKAFYDTKREIARAERQGARVELMTHQRWCDEVAERMKTRCEHGKAAS
jgi:hypothetical protein